MAFSWSFISRGIHEEVDDGVDDGVGHGEPVEGQEDVLHKDRLDGTEL